MKLVYVCHRFQDHPALNAERVRRICEVLKHDCVPLGVYFVELEFAGRVETRKNVLSPRRPQ